MPISKTTRLGGAFTTVACLTFASPCAAIWNTNFDALTAGPGGSATGIWREVTNPQTGAGIDSAFAVALTTSGEVKAVTDPTQPSRLDETFPYRDINFGESVTLPDGTTIIAPTTIDLPFAAGTNGDFINIETEGGTSSTVTIDFGARITNPMLSFSDIDSQTTLDFGSNSFTVADSTANLGSTGTAVNNTGPSGDFIFGEEAAGSLQFTGVFTTISFTVINAAPTGAGNEDRTGYMVSTDFAPEAVPEPSTAGLLLGLSVVLFAAARRFS